MTAISGTLTNADTSGTFTPTKDVSEFKVKANNSNGDVFLESYNPATTGWDVEATGGRGAVLTPDYAITYRFRSTGTGSFTFYMGP